MSLPSRIRTVMTLSVLVLLPAPAFGGGFGHFGYRAATQSSPAHQWVSTLAEGEVAEATAAPPLMDCWEAVGSGMNGNGEFDTWTSDCFPTAYEAIMDVYQNSPEGYTLYSFSVRPCECTGVAEASEAKPRRNPEPGEWVARAIVISGRQEIKTPMMSGDLRTLARVVSGRYRNTKLITFVRDSLQ